MRTTYCLQVYCRPCKADKKGLAPLELSLIVNGKRVFVQLPRKEYPEVFKKNINAKRNNPIKEYIDEVRNKFNDIQLDMMRNNIPLTAETLREYYRSGGVHSLTVEDAFNEYSNMLKKRVGVNLTLAAYKKYLDAFNCFYRYYDKKKELTTVTPAVIEGFLIDCNTKYVPSTVCGIMTKLKTVFNFQRDNNRLQINPFINVKYSKGKKDIEYLTEDEIEKIYNLQLDNKSLSNVRDAFILQASTGLAYIDIFNLKKEDIKIDADGTHYIVKNRHKTNTQYTTVILPKGVEVLKRNNYQLHIISNQKYNYMLKLIQDLAGIKTKMTTHLARKTFATYLLNHNVRLEVVSKALGHSSTKVTQSSYSQLLNKTIVDEIKAVF